MTDSSGPMPMPTDNPLTVEGVALGRRLFHETALSDDGTLSCASCHVQANGFGDPRRFSIGTTGQEGTRHAPALVNLGWDTAFFWDGRRASLEAQAHDPVVNPIEMNARWPEVVDRLRQLPQYPPLFHAAFGTPHIDSVLVVRAIAQFERTLVSFNARYDQFHATGDSTVFTDEERRGLVLYVGRGACAACHPLGMFTDHGLRNVGLEPFNVDSGLAGITGLSTDLARFKVSSLRNVGVSAPYLHDGRFSDLMAVMEFYFEHLEATTPNLDHLMIDLLDEQGQFTHAEKMDPIAFLHTLTDPEFANDPSFSAP
ncbi:MAG: cytochrome-c peroxidase [Flavobacteriales bacterium]|nr:cytochrome-c peroxidase [Flavobacteriales bacterium]